MPASQLAISGPTSGQLYGTIVPRQFKKDGTKRWLIYLHYAGADAYQAWTPGGFGVLKLLSGIAAEIPVLVIDGGTIPGSGTDNGQFTGGNATAIARIADAYAWCVDPTKGGGKTDKVLLAGASQGSPGVLNYAKANASKAAAIVGILPVSDLDDIRNFNRPNGWTGTTPNPPNNTDSVNAAYGLASGSTGDFPTHGASLAALPSNANPATDHAGLAGIPVGAWASSSDPTVSLSTVTALWQTALGGNVTLISPDAGHTDASVGNVPPSEVLAFLRPYAQ